VGVLTELDAFYTEHRLCGELEAGVDGPIVWMSSSAAPSPLAEIQRTPTAPAPR
jgi:hypothetical protein